MATAQTQNQSVTGINLNRPILCGKTGRVQSSSRPHVKRKSLPCSTTGVWHDRKSCGLKQFTPNLNKCLHYLDVSCNKITRDGMGTFADGLKSNTTLAAKDLSFHTVENAGQRSPAKPASHNRSLQV